MANPDRDTIYSNDGNRTVYSRESSSTGWFVGIIVALALLAIGYLVFSANSGPDTSSTTVNTTETPLVVEPAPTMEAPATGVETAPATEAPAVTEPPPAADTPAAEPAPAAPAAPAAN